MVLFLTVLISYAYFYQAGGWNQNSRFALVRAITNDHTLRIDPYKLSTGDIAAFNGHYYSDKAPGLALAAVPIVEVARYILVREHGDPESYEGLALLSYVATVLTVGLLTAFATVSLFSLAIDLGSSQAGALLATLIFALFSPMWALATLFIGHAMAASCLVFAFAAAVRVGLGSTHGDVDVTSTRRRDIGLGLLVGFGGGWATVTEFPAVVAAAMIATLALVNAISLGRSRAFRVLAPLATSAFFCLAVLMLYQYLCFGSPFHIAYASEQSYEGMKQGLFGVATPRFIRLRHILVSEYRGLLPLAPVLAVAPVGMIALLFKGRQARRSAIVASLIAAYYILLNASYTYWEGGWSFGPRHMSPAIPFLALGLAAFWSVTPRIARAALVGLTAWGAVLSLIAVATMPQPPEYFRRPVVQLLLPAFLAGDLALNPQRFTDGGPDPERLREHVDPKAAWNVGMKLGLHGLASLIPLALIWLGAGIWLMGARTGQPTEPSGSSNRIQPVPA